MLTLMCHAGTSHSYAYYAARWGIHQVSDGPVPWYVMAKFGIEKLPALIVECDRHPYEIIGVFYGEANIRAACGDPPRCPQERERVDLRKGVLLGKRTVRPLEAVNG